MHTVANDRVRGMQEAVIQVRAGFFPGRIWVHAGKPVRLAFDRREEGACSEFIEVPQLRVRAHLSPYQATAVEFTPWERGTYDLVCGMGMLRGQIIAD